MGRASADEICRVAAECVLELGGVPGEKRWNVWVKRKGYKGMSASVVRRVFGNLEGLADAADLRYVGRFPASNASSGPALPLTQMLSKREFVDYHLAMWRHWLESRREKGREKSGKRRRRQD